MKPFNFKIAILALVCLGQVQLVAAYVTGFFPWHIFAAFLLWGFGLLTVIVTAIIDSIRKCGLTRKWTLPIFTSLTLGIILGWVLSDYQNKQRRENAEELISALKEYKADKGKYPESHMDLKPDYLSDIPTSN